MEALSSGQKMGRRNMTIYKRGESSDVGYSTNFFLEPPYYESLTLQDFETIARERLKVLRVFETAGFKAAKGSPEYVESVVKELSKELRHRYVRPASATSLDILAENRRRDVISHFLLRMVYTRNEEQRRWFIQQEVDLFRFRLVGEEADKVAQFLRDSKLDYSPLPVEEYNNIRPALEKSTFLKHGVSSQETEFYKIDFLDALEFIRHRKIFLNQGWAYVPRRLLVDVVAGRFREHLSCEIAKLARTMSECQEDTRLAPILAMLASGDNASYTPGELDYGITIESLDQLSAESFPMCARNMHEHLRKDHHLKHFARLQYGFFLKGIGLPMDDNVKLLRTEFTKHGVKENHFKTTAYTIRHMYGKEGRRVNYTPPSCLKIITSNPPSGAVEHHGCPFKHFNQGLLAQRMKSYGINHQDSEQIISLVKHGHYQVACTKYFEVTHKEKLDGVVEGIQHPNHYFEESRRLLHPESMKERPVTFRRRNMLPPLSGQIIKQEPNQQNLEMDFQSSEIDDFHLTDEDMKFLEAAEKMEIDTPPVEVEST